MANSFTFAQVKPFLKLSKTVLTDKGPYQIVPDEYGDWYDIKDWTGQVAGQVSHRQLMIHRMIHSGGCSNQNVVHPDGMFNGAAECGCQS